MFARLWLPAVLFAILSPSLAYADPVYSAEEQGLSYTAVGNSVTTDNKLSPQSAIAVIAVPGRAKVVKAYLYWSGKVIPASAADTSVDLILPNGKIRKVYADDVASTLDGGLAYSCRADVTDLVRSNGVYRIKELDLDPVGDRGVSGSWSLIFVYKVAGLASKSRVAIYDSLNEGVSEPERGNLETRMGPALIVETRPRDGLYFLKRAEQHFQAGNYIKSVTSYGAAIIRAPVFASSYILQVRLNGLITSVVRGLMFFRPLLVKINAALAGFFIAYAVLLNAIYLVLTVAAFRLAKQWAGQTPIAYDKFVQSHKAVPVSILISAYNEEHAISRTLASLMRLKYPEYEVIVINDGSKDRTLEVIRQEYGLREYETSVPKILSSREISRVYRSERFPNLYVIDKKNSGKADSLNAGINLSRYPLFCTIDADTILEEDSLFQLALPILTEPDEVIGTTGMVRLYNGCSVENGKVTKKEAPVSFLAAMQVIEYIRAYSIGRMGWNLFNSHVIVSGAFSLYRKDIVVRLGGYHRYAIGEDVELNMRIHKSMLEGNKKYQIVYVMGARCLTHAPADVRSLARQRNRWQQGLMTTIRLNARIIFNPRYGRLGTLAMPFYALLELPAPVLEFFGYVVMPLFAFFGMVNWVYVLVLLGLVVLYGCGLSFLAVLLDKKYFHFYDPASYKRLFSSLLFESVGFHQLTVFWRMRGIEDYLKEVHVREMGWRSPDRLKAGEYVLGRRAS